MVAPFSFLGSSVSFQPEALDYFARIEANGGTISDEQKIIANARILGAKGLGALHSVNYLPKIIRRNSFYGNGLLAVAVPMVKEMGGTVDSLVNFVSGDYGEDTGLESGGSPKYLNTGLAANLLTADDTTFGVLNFSSVGNFGHHGATNGYSEFFQFQMPWITFPPTLAYSDQYNTGGGRIEATVTAPFRWMFATRRSGPVHEFWQNGSLVANNATSGGSLPTEEIYVFARNNGGSPDDFRADRLGFYCIASGMTAEELQACYLDDIAEATALGRLADTDDSFFHLQGATPGAALTAAILQNSSNHAGVWGGVTMTDPSDAMHVRANGAPRTAAVVVSGTDFPAGSLDLCFDFDHSYANQTINLPVVIVGPLIVTKLKIYLGPLANNVYGLFDYIGPQFVNGQYSMVQLLTDVGGVYAFNIETNPGGPTMHSSYITVTPHTWIDICHRTNTDSGISELTIYNSLGNVIGSTSTVCSTGTDISLVTVGNNEAGVQPGQVSKLQGLRWSSTNAAYPVLP